MNEQEIEAGLPQTPGYRYAHRVGDRLYVAGQVPNDPSGDIVGIGDPHAQGERCLANLYVVLRCHGFAPGDIRRLTIYVVGERSNLTAAWRAVQTAFPEGVPPATLLGVATLGYANQLVEIDAEIVKSA